MSAVPRGSRLIPILIVVIIIGFLAAGGGYYAYQSSLQPNIQATNLQFASPDTNPQTATVQDTSRISGSGSFSYTASVNGTINLVFDNSFSGFSSKAIAVTYTAAGVSGSRAFTVHPGQSYTFSIPLNGGQSVSGTFTISGSSNNDVDFTIQQYTCTQTVPFSLVLVNSGSANGYATLTLRYGGGVQVYSNRFFLLQGQQTPVSGTASISDCASHTLSPSISQTKA